MGELTLGVNWLAVGIGTLLSFFLGAMWFSPYMFGVKWAEGVGNPIGEDSKQPVGALVLQLLGTFLLAWLIGIAAAREELLLAIMIGLLVSVLLAASDLFGGSTRYAAIVEGAFPIAMLVIMLLCQAIL